MAAGTAPPSPSPSPLEVSDALLAEVDEALRGGNGTLAAALAAPLHPADRARLLELLDADRRPALVRALGPDLDGLTLTHLDAFVRDRLLEALGPDAAAAALVDLESDDLVEVLGGLEPAAQAAILSRLPAAERAAAEEGLAFPDDSAGRLMRRELVAVPAYWTVGQAVDYLRARDELPDDLYELVLVDPRFRPVGAVPLGAVLRAAADAPLGGLTRKEPRSFPADADQEEVARAFRRYGLVTAPVVDARGRLLGVVTIDDVADVIEEEADEDILRLGGVAEPGIHAPALRTSAKRLPWLAINLATAAAASLVIQRFEDAIGQLVALAVLMPIAASLGGNAGTQALTVTVRAIAEGSLGRANLRRVLGKEALVGLLNGAAFLAAGGALVLLWFGTPALALVFGAALLANLLVAAVAGVAIPLLLHRLGFDPAVSSGVFLTAITDAVGFFSFLGLASWLLL
jgi:magnesium transporter